MVREIQCSFEIEMFSILSINMDNLTAVLIAVIRRLYSKVITDFQIIVFKHIVLFFASLNNVKIQVPEH